ncbi:MAG: glutamate racemase [Candidatus Melainabacteria bacterium]
MPEPDTPNTQAPIGVFDSGVGGLSVLDHLVEMMPHEHFVYFGDTANMPYGQKHLTELSILVRRITTWLVHQKQVKLLVVACNTASLVVPHEITVPVVDPITAVCHQIAHDDAVRRIGVMATTATVMSESYPRILHQLHPQKKMEQSACPGLAYMIEQGESDGPVSEFLIQESLSPLQEWQMDALVLGCTHYPFARQQIANILSPSVRVLDPAIPMAHRVHQLLKSQHSLRTDGAGQVDYFVSGPPDHFLRVARRLPLAHIQPGLPTQLDLD